tara:strand:+ start:94 stop:315 length:222 start_codon:yes stop_codon:yes gene_type:complete
MSDEQEKDLEDRLYEISNIIASATHKLEEIPIEQWNEYEEHLDDTLKNLKRLNKGVESVIWLINNPEDEEELS